MDNTPSSTEDNASSAMRERAVIASILQSQDAELPPNILRLLDFAPDGFDEPALGHVAFAVRQATTNGHFSNVLAVHDQLSSEQWALEFSLSADSNALPLGTADIEAGTLLEGIQSKLVIKTLDEASNEARRHPKSAASIADRAVKALNSLAIHGTRTPADLAEAEWLGHLNKATCPASGLAQINVPKREPVVGEWFKEGDLGFIYGKRGLGKTWLALHVARQIVEGGMVGDWKVHRPRRALYVDGEMPLDGIRDRDAALAGQPTDALYFLHHEALFHETGKVLNLTNPIVQAALLQKCQQDKIEVLVLDNLSCLFSGIKENDADAWEQVLPWLLELRRNRIAVVFVAHAGRNGFMRGTSRREDAAFWMIELTEAKDASEVQTGAKFGTRFTKNRNAPDADCPPLEWSFILPRDETRAQVAWKKLSTAQIFRDCIENGLTSATDIAEEMGISKGQVSKLAKKQIDAGWLTKESRDYKRTGQA